ncbi:hypothetical protein N9K98_07410 [Luminiphilus sp.]|nr:hypothetical protein [Luminiphilus sp.]
MKRVALLLCLSHFAFADQITIPNPLTNNTVADANAVQANFDVIASESNENDLRITGNERAISGVSEQVLGYTYEWLGYTTELFEASSDNRAHGYNLSKHCKAEFGNAASVANMQILESLMRVGAAFPAPTGDAWLQPKWDFIWSSEYGNTFFAGNWSAITRPCMMEPAGVSFNINCGLYEQSGSASVACVGT